MSRITLQAIDFIDKQARPVFQLRFHPREHAMAATRKTRETRKLAARGGVIRAHQLAMAERDKKLEPALRKLGHLSGEMAARELELLGLGLWSHMTVNRVRARLGLSRPCYRQGGKKANEDIAQNN
jgi:hypothetical protein